MEDANSIIVYNDFRLKAQNHSTSDESASNCIYIITVFKIYNQIFFCTTTKGTIISFFFKFSPSVIPFSMHLRYIHIDKVYNC